jgi:hypothetical protein
MYELAHGFWREHSPQATFLRAERLPDGRRTFRLEEGEPLETSYGEDLYHKIFGPQRETHAPSGNEASGSLPRARAWTAW